MDYQDEKYVTNFNEEGEDQDSYCLEELPLKVEINENDFLHMTESDDLDSIFQCNIKAEPLEENYVDQENDLLLEEAATNGDVLLEGDTPVPSNKALEENLAALQSKRKVKRHFKCEDCSATFKYQSTYDYHIKSKCGSRMIADKNQLVVKTKDEAFTCNHCQKKMCSRTSLMVHMRIHNGAMKIGANKSGETIMNKQPRIKSILDQYETDETKNLSLEELQLLVLRQQLITAKLQLEFYKKKFAN